MHVEMSFLEICQCFLLCSGFFILMASPYILMRFLGSLWHGYYRIREQKKETKRLEEEADRILDRRSRGIKDTSEDRSGSKHNPVYYTELDDDDFI